MPLAFSIMLGLEIISLLIMGAVILEFQHTRGKYEHLVHTLEEHSAIGKEKLSLLLVWLYIGGFAVLSALGFLMLLW